MEAVLDLQAEPWHQTFELADFSPDEERMDAKEIWENYPKKKIVKGATLKEGYDLHGLPWHKFNHPRSRFRESRMSQYACFHSLEYDKRAVLAEVNPVLELQQGFYDFKYTYLNQKNRKNHFQLLNLVWATSNTDVIYLGDQYVAHFCTLEIDKTKALFGSETEYWPFNPMTMVAKDGFLAVGGDRGQILCKRLDSPGHSFLSKVERAANHIMNAIDIIENINGDPQLLISSNDDCVHTMNLETFQQVDTFQLDWPVNFSKLSPDRRMISCVGDGTLSCILDARSGEIVKRLAGHQDHSFACVWSPTSPILITGSQDQTLRFYDTRKMDRAYHVLGAKMASFRSLRFTPDGRFLAAAEDADFVHIYDSRANFNTDQIIDMFGEISGISFSPDGNQLFIGNADHAFGGILEFERKEVAHDLPFV